MYWEKPGIENTTKTIELALSTAQERRIEHIIVASSTGETAVQLAEKLNNFVCVTYVNGFFEPGQSTMLNVNRKVLEQRGIKILSTTHVLSGAERGISRKFQGSNPVEIMAAALRMLGQGVKVCTEIAIMALDAGLIPYGQEVIAIAGTGKGADTAVIVKPAHAANVLDTYISEIICKPKTK
ncbi:pyruvate kinase alpha/beta domain-containing protein [Dendrosporobacter sp. 1207_IL3150]|uniref:pyruvate kinase alpha/beta domain-containing protein n=1 Tax=Dendrosporobacter sp. 1207_IL3150 TaxID=3084054 RepID=UPI002FDA7AAD